MQWLHPGGFQIKILVVKYNRSLQSDIKYVIRDSLSIDIKSIASSYWNHERSRHMEVFYVVVSNDTAFTEIQKHLRASARKIHKNFLKNSSIHQEGILVYT